MRKNTPLKRGFKRLSGLLSVHLEIYEFVNWWFRFFDVTNRLETTKNMISLSICSNSRAKIYGLVSLNINPGNLEFENKLRSIIIEQGSCMFKLSTKVPQQTVIYLKYSHLIRIRKKCIATIVQCCFMLYIFLPDIFVG